MLVTLHTCGSIVSLFQAVSSDVAVVHTAKVLPAGMHLYDRISGNDIVFQHIYDHVKNSHFYYNSGKPRTPNDLS